MEDRATTRGSRADAGEGPVHGTVADHEVGWPVVAMEGRGVGSALGVEDPGADGLGDGLGDGGELGGEVGGEVGGRL